MSINVIEGNFIKMSNNYDEIRDITKNLTGYLRVSVKKNNRFEEGYIFLEGGKQIGYYYDNGMDEKFGKSAKEMIDAMKNSNYVVDIYEYDMDKLKLMKELFKEIFIKDSSKPEKIVITQKTSDENKLNYQKITLNIPEGKPLKLGAKDDWGHYLKGKVLLDVFKKESGNYKRGYVVYNNETPILAAYEDNNGVLFGKEAYSIIENLLNDPDAVIDVYEYDDFKINMLKEYYPKMNLIEEDHNNGFDEEEDEEDLEKFMESLVNNQKKVKEEENLSRDELLEKFGIKTPDDELINNFVSSVIAPSDDELKNLENEFKEKITKFLREEDDIQSYSLDLSVEYNEDEGYICKCHVDLIPKKKFGIIKKELNTEYIIDKMNRIIKDNILDIKPEIVVNVK